MGNCISQTDQREFLSSFQNSAVDSAFLEDPDSFRVYVKKKHKFLPGALKVTDREILFFHGCNEVQSWPFQYLRRYGFTSGGVFFFESGRRCMSGEGLHTFQTCQSELIFQLVQGRIQDSANMNSALRDSAGQSIVDNIRNACLSHSGRLPPTTRIHPLQRYFSEGTSNAEGAYRSLRLHRHRHRHRHRQPLSPGGRPLSLSATLDPRRSSRSRPSVFENEAENAAAAVADLEEEKHPYANLTAHPLRLSASENHPGAFDFAFVNGCYKNSIGTAQSSSGAVDFPAYSVSEANSPTTEKCFFDRYVNLYEMKVSMCEEDENAPLSPLLDYASVNFAQAYERDSSPYSSVSCGKKQSAASAPYSSTTVDYTEIDLDKTQAVEVAAKVLELENSHRRNFSTS